MLIAQSPWRIFQIDVAYKAGHGLWALESQLMAHSSKPIFQLVATCKPGYGLWAMGVC